MSFTYTLNALGNRTQIVDDTGTSTFTYDPLSRLTSATYPGPTTDTYTYDAVGNRTAKNATSYTYDDADQMTAVGGVSYTYDNNGNQITRGVSDTFTWDHENRLIATSLGSSTYDYNSDGLRVSRTSNSVTTDYVWDVNRSIPVILQDGTNTYVYGRGLISATDSSGDQTYGLIDGLGSTVGLCDGSGNMIGTYAYDAFGIIRAQTGSSDNYFLFTGEQRDDESGYDYLRARYYDSEVGRFLGQDVASPDWRAPVTINRFVYVGNDPVNKVDPTGLEWYDCDYSIEVAGYGEHWVGCEWRDDVHVDRECFNEYGCIEVTIVTSLHENGYGYVTSITSVKPTCRSKAYSYTECDILPAIEIWDRDEQGNPRQAYSGTGCCASGPVAVGPDAVVYTFASFYEPARPNPDGTTNPPKRDCYRYEYHVDRGSARAWVCTRPW